MRTLSTDILILGSGGAGLFAALHAHQADAALDITVAVKGLLGKCGLGLFLFKIVDCARMRFSSVHNR